MSVRLYDIILTSMHFLSRPEIRYFWYKPNNYFLIQEAGHEPSNHVLKEETGHGSYKKII